MRRAMLAAFTLVLATATGCQQPTPTPTVAPDTGPVSVIVPLNTPTPAPTDTPSYNIQQVMGRWLLDFRFDFTKGQIIEHTYFVLSIGADVDITGQISGRGEVATMVDHPGCVARVRSGGDFWARLEGRLEEAGEDLFLVTQLKPEDGMLLQFYDKLCPDRTHAEYTSQLLWQGLRLAEITEFRIPAQHGARVKLTDSIASPALPALNGDLEVTITVSRQ